MPGLRLTHYLGRLAVRDFKELSAACGAGIWLEVRAADRIATDAGNDARGAGRNPRAGAGVPL